MSIQRDPEEVSPRDENTVPLEHAAASPQEIATVGIHEAVTSAPELSSFELHDRPSFAPGALLADRYRIVRFVAQGGMGEVYEAHDLTLNVRLALKTIRPQIARDPIAVERFKREISIARRITHPNISRIYDVGLHRGEGEPTMFLTMEFLAGETLSSLIRRKGRLAESEALPLAEQIAAGLAAAHEAGVIHRDFKSPNVMLVTVPATGSGIPRIKAVVTDFGLARPEASEEGLTTLSESGAISGTPAYMAPEQVQGLRLTAAADLYAFGIVLYEMMTGRRPFEGDTPMSIAVKRLTDKPVPPKVHVPELGQTWNDVILRCLEREPGARFSSALEIAAALRNNELPAATVPQTVAVPAPGSKRSRARLAVLVAAALMVIAAAIAAVYEARKPDAPPVAASANAVPLRRAVAILPLRNNSGQADGAWLSTAITEMMATELSAGGRVRVASGAETAALASDLGLSDGRTPSKAQRDRVRQALGVDSFITGSYTLIGDPGTRLLRVDLSLVDATSGNTIRSHDASGSERQLFDVVARIGGVLRQPLGAGALSAKEEVEVQASLPSNPEAAHLYTEGIARLRQYDAKRAAELLEQAAAADGKHPFIHHALSSAYAALGNDAAAAKESERAVALSGSLGHEQKLLIEERLHVTRKNWDRAIEIERSLRETFPDNVEYGVSLANSQMEAGRSREALATIETLRKLPRPASLDPRVDLIQALVYQAMGDSARQRTLAQAAAAKGRASGARALVARARFIEAAALLELGEIDTANAAIDDAQSLFRGAGDESSVARCIELTATAVSARGDLESAQKLHEQARDLFERVGNRTAAAQAVLSMGAIALSRGRVAEAEPLFDRSLAVLREAGQRNAAAVALNDIGAMLFLRGELEAARRRYMEAFQLFSELGDRSGQAAALTNVGEILSSRGDLEEAWKMHTESLSMNRAIRNKAGEAYDLARLGEILALRGDLVAARRRYEEALAIQKQADQVAGAETQVALAKLAVDEGRQLAESERSARAAEEILRTQGAEDVAVKALAVVADALLAQKKTAEALATAERAWTLGKDGQDRRVRLAAAISVARARAASGRPADVDAALKFLETERVKASRAGFAGAELEARLALGEIEAAAGRAQGRKRLSRVAADAKSKGFQRIAARAAAGAA